MLECPLTSTNFLTICSYYRDDFQVEVFDRLRTGIIIIFSEAGSRNEIVRRAIHWGNRCHVLWYSQVIWAFPFHKPPIVNTLIWPVKYHSYLFTPFTRHLTTTGMAPPCWMIPVFYWLLTSSAGLLSLHNQAAIARSSLFAADFPDAKNSSS